MIIDIFFKIVPTVYYSDHPYEAFIEDLRKEDAPFFDGDNFMANGRFWSLHWIDDLPLVAAEYDEEGALINPAIFDGPHANLRIWGENALDVMEYLEAIDYENGTIFLGARGADFIFGDPPAEPRIEWF